MTKVLSANERSASAATLAAGSVSLLLFAYVAVRAATLSITHDEALTYFWHASSDVSRILRFRTPGLPDNNHVLHTLLAKLSVQAFGLSELTLRLPSLIGCLLYLVGLNQLLRRIVPGWGQVLGVLALGLHPYLIDFLGLARGYGLGLGFTMLGLAQLSSPRSRVHPGRCASLPRGRACCCSRSQRWRTSPSFCWS